MKRKDKLKEMKMPGKPMAEEELDLDLAMDDELSMDEEMPEDMEMMEDEEGEDMEMSPLEDISDEDLMEEMKKRGLMPDEEIEEEPEIEEDEEEDEEY